MAILNFKTESDETLPPDERQAGDIFSRLGYRIADAIADIVDNSVDAEATHVHVRFARSSGGIHSVLIADNGCGMNDEELREAMRFGSRSSKAGSQLGKYGIGLKSASLSQAEVVTVLSRRSKSTIGRRWTLPNIKKNWTCEILHREDVAKAFDTTFGEFRIARSGTVVIWEELEHLQALPDNVDKVLDRTTKELLTELGIRFHRFLEGGGLRISIDQQFGFEEPSEMPIYVTALDPFAYEQSPNKEYPARLKLRIGPTTLSTECHIWPPLSNATGYRLGGGKVALRQGFYFYRNDRIIQAGGWNQIRADDGEPHLSLARVKIELPSTLDSKFKLDVTKSRLDPTPEFASGLFAAKSTKGITFEKYLVDAESAYRKQKKKERARFPVIPGAGISPKAQQAIANILKEEGTGRPIKVSFRWAKFEADEIVRVNAREREILLNTRFKADLVEGTTNDARVLKMALMFLLQEELEKTFSTKVSSEWLQRVNLALIASLKS